MFLQIVLLVILIFLNGVFASSEIAFLSVNKAKLHSDIKKKNKKAKKVKKLLENSSGFLATIQIGITLAGFLSSAFAAETFADEIVTKLTFINVSANILKPIIVVIVTLILSYFTLVFGELVPKRIAMKYPDKIAYGMVNIITILMKCTYPFVWLLTKSTNLCCKLFKIGENTEEKITEETLRLEISEAMDAGAIEKGEKTLIYNIFRFNDIKVREIMTDVEDMIAVDINISNKDLMEVIRKNKYTRIPVYDKNINNIVGILNTRDIIYKFVPDNKFNLMDILNKPYFVHPSEMVDDVFRQMQKDRQTLSIARNKNGKVVGLMTIEDALEEIVGNIFDEYDSEYEEK